MKKVALLIDGGYLKARTMSKNGIGKGNPYDADFIEKFAKSCIAPDENLFRILYYDCHPYNGTELMLPISQTKQNFSKQDHLLNDLAKKPYFATRIGELKFRGWTLKKPYSKRQSPLTDNDFTPNFMQKGVDTRIGLDIATLAQKNIDVIKLVSGDGDFVPLLKYARESGKQTASCNLPNSKVSPVLLPHLDYVTDIIAWH